MPVFNAEELWSKEFYGFEKEAVIGISRSNDNIESFWKETWSNNLKLNEVYLRDIPPASDLFSVIGKKAIVVGAGPSAKKNVDRIKLAQEKGYKIIAVDKIYNWLKEHGVKPDYAITYDANERVVDYFKDEHLDCYENIIVCVTSHPSVFEKLRKAECNMWAFAPINPLSRFWRGMKNHGTLDDKFFCLRGGQLVTLAAVDLALFSNANPLIMIGNELCWDSVEGIIADFGDPSKAHVVHLDDGRVTVMAFYKSASAFTIYPALYPDVDFIDASLGIVEGWRKKRL